MSSLRKLAAAALLSAAMITPVFAQAAIQEPGAFAFYYPNADVLNGGVPTPAASLTPSQLYRANTYDAMGGAGGASRIQRYRSCDPACGTFLGNVGRRGRRR
jgi:hypothetical protein